MARGVACFWGSSGRRPQLPAPASSAISGSYTTSLPRAVEAITNRQRRRAPRYKDPALAGRQVSGIARDHNLLESVGVGGVWHPVDLPKGYHTASRGQSRTKHVAVAPRAAPGIPRGWA